MYTLLGYPIYWDDDGRFGCLEANGSNGVLPSAPAQVFSCGSPIQSSIEEECMEFNHCGSWGISLSIFALLSGYTFADSEKGRPKPIFTLTQGQGVELCEAYLSKLNATEYFDNDPRKGRVKEPKIPGFIDLKPVPLLSEEVNHAILKCDGFIGYQDQDYYEKKRAYIERLENKDIQKQALEAFQAGIKYIQDNIDHRALPVLGYQETVDIDNDGRLDAVVSNWLGQVGFSGLPGFGTMFSVIFDDHFDRIEESKMREVFGHPEWVDWPSITDFRYMVYPVYISRYGYKYYFDGFFDRFQGDISGGRRFAQSLDFTLGVFLHKQGKTRQECEYYWSNWDIYGSK
jgi:hypothetical protein